MSSAPSFSHMGQRSRKAKRPSAKRALSLVRPAPFVGKPLPRLELLERKGPVLRPNPISEMVEEEVCGLNLMAGCPQGCTFCYARAYPGYPGDEVVHLYSNTLDLLKNELQDRRTLPQAVYLCPWTDPFPPFQQVQEEACRVMELLAEYGIETWFMTRGFIRPFAVDRLVQHRELVKITIALTTLDNALRRTLEPLAAPPRLRLRQLAELRERNVPTHVAIEPLIPDLTDTRENLQPLITALAEVGVKHVTAGYLFLRQGIRDNLARELGPFGLAEPILEKYRTGPVLPMGSVAPAKHLPRELRQRGYALLMALAAEQGITVTISRMTNPDFQPPIHSSPRLRSPGRQLELCLPDPTPGAWPA